MTTITPKAASRSLYAVEISDGWHLAELRSKRPADILPMNVMNSQPPLGTPFN
jgi:hypothetical protein